MNRIYGVHDIKSQSLVGGLVMFRHDAAAIRYFIDGLNHQGSLTNLHPEDFALYHLGHLIDPDEDQPNDPLPYIDPCTPQLILSGAQWVASQPSPEDAQ